MRSVPLWIGKTHDSKAPPRVRLRVFEREDGICFLSDRKIRPGERWELHHKIALCNGGTNSEDNLAPALVAPHRTQTAADVAEKARVAKRKANHLGIKRKSRFRNSRDGDLITRLTSDGPRTERRT